jgi:hypothetical protein
MELGMSKTRFIIDPKNISHERLQDEVIIINLASGAYFSGTGPAADVWTLLLSGASLDEAAVTLAAVYSSDESAIREDLNACVSMLLERQVLSEAADVLPIVTVPILPEVVRGAWASPVFDEYTDMWDLLQFDPIHDVGEAGWPYATPNAKL